MGTAQAEVQRPWARPIEQYSQESAYSGASQRFDQQVNPFQTRPLVAGAQETYEASRYVDTRIQGVSMARPLEATRCFQPQGCSRPIPVAQRQVQEVSRPAVGAGSSLSRYPSEERRVQGLHGRQDVIQAEAGPHELKTLHPSRVIQLPIAPFVNTQEEQRLPPSSIGSIATKGKQEQVVRPEGVSLLWGNPSLWKKPEENRFLLKPRFPKATSSSLSTSVSTSIGEKDDANELSVSKAVKKFAARVLKEKAENMEIANELDEDKDGSPGLYDVISGEVATESNMGNFYLVVNGKKEKTAVCLIEKECFQGLKTLPGG